LLACLGSLNSMILIGQERIRAINIITIAQILTIFVVLLVFYFLTDYREVMVYVIALYGSFGVLFLGTLVLVSTRLRWGDLSGMKQVIRDILKFGSWAQTANIFQLLNYRISYYFIERFLGEASLGVYSTGVQLSEGVWLVPRSMSMVQYSRITNEKTREYAARITLAFSKIGVLLSILLVGILMLLPTSFYTWIFGPEFSGVKVVIISLAVGIITLSFSILISTFFIGLGKPVHSAIASGIGLVFTLGLSLWLIPIYGIVGAGIAASVAYTSSTIYQLILFVIMAKVKAHDFLVRTSEVKMMIRELKGSLK
jgi:O-antigen/teichoic acid export membrane protein